MQQLFVSILYWLGDHIALVPKLAANMQSRAVMASNNL
jgi:trans-aconitate methyltransferase